MLLRSLRIATDYNRGLLLPIRFLHGLAHFAAILFSPLWSWAGHRTRGRWARPLLIAIPAGLLVMPLDNFITGLARALNDRSSTIHLGGDVVRVLNAMQEYGGIVSLVLTGAIIWLLDPHNRRRIADLAVAAALAALLVPVLKMIIGRPRPRSSMAEMYDATAFLGPFGSAPMGPELGVRHAWEFWLPRISDIQSMPSAHTASAAVLSVFLFALYPKLKPLLITMVVIVGLCRVLFTAHWPSDVVIGAGVGVAVAQVVLARGSKRGGWGCRLLPHFPQGQTKA